MMNVNNPDFSVLLQELVSNGQFLPNVGQQVIEGSPWGIGRWSVTTGQRCRRIRDCRLSCSSTSVT